MDVGEESDNLYVEAMDEAQILSSLLWVSELIATKTDIDELLQLIVELTPKLINLNRCTIFLWDDEKREFTPRISYSPERGERKSQLASFYSLRLKQEDMPELVKKLIDENVPVVITNAAKSKLIPKRYVEFFKIKSMLILPLLSNGEFLGAMCLDHIKNSHHFTQKEIRIALGLCTHAALSIRNAQLITSLREEQYKTKQIIEGMAEGLLVITPDKRILMTNSEMERLTGLARQEMLGLNCYNLYSGGIMCEDRNFCEDQCPLTTQFRGPKKVEGAIKTRDGRDIYISGNYSPVNDVDGNLQYAVLTVRDISETKWVEDALHEISKKLNIREIGQKKHDEASPGGF